MARIHPSLSARNEKPAEKRVFRFNWGQMASVLELIEGIESEF